MAQKSLGTTALDSMQPPVSHPSKVLIFSLPACSQITHLRKLKRIPCNCTTNRSQYEQSDKWGKLNISESIMMLEHAGRHGGREGLLQCL
jgi:hypothetical protein